MRRIYDARGQRHFVGSLDRMIADVEAEIAAFQTPTPPEAS
jgi:hypothetical protein